MFISNKALVFQLLKNMLYRHIKLNDFVSFVRFSMNGSPHVKISGPINRLSLFSTNAHCRSIDDADVTSVKGADERNKFFEKINNQ